jgi:hypothetical protein
LSVASLGSVLSGLSRWSTMAWRTSSEPPGPAARFTR